MFDHEKIKIGVRLILEGVGEDVEREGLLETPDRVARMYEEIFAGMYQDAAEPLSKRFHVAGNEMVLEKDIVFYSTCEHHLMPFFGMTMRGVKKPGSKTVSYVTRGIFAEDTALQDRFFQLVK